MVKALQEQNTKLKEVKPKEEVKPKVVKSSKSVKPSVSNDSDDSDDEILKSRNVDDIDKIFEKNLSKKRKEEKKKQKKDKEPVNEEAFKILEDELDKFL
jgi:hypothetical protein